MVLTKSQVTSNVMVCQLVNRYQSTEVLQYFIFSVKQTKKTAWLKMKALWSFKIMGTSHPLTEFHMPEDLNILLSSTQMMNCTHYSLNGVTADTINLQNAEEFWNRYDTHMVPLSDEQTPGLSEYLMGHQQPHRCMCQSVPPKCKRKNWSESITVTWNTLRMTKRYYT